MEGKSKEVFTESAIDRAEASRVDRLRNKLAEAIRNVAELEVELSRGEGAIQGVPHYSVIERRAHELGRLLSRQVQQLQMNELAASTRTAKCPICGKFRELSTRTRQVTTVDGQTNLQELVGECCRKLFFPSA
jgi:DNA repair exonuclease SbcCD ATPase subunit